MKTRAAVFRAVNQPMDVREIEIDSPTGDEVLVEMAAAGVCGSDLHVVKGEWGRPTPMVLGHEGAGVVSAVGPDVSDVAVGERVILSWAPGCQQCASCRRNRPAACSAGRAAIAAGTLPNGRTGLRENGQTLFRMTSVGAFADHVLVPQRAAIPIPDDVPLEHAALLGCAALTGVGAVENAAGVEPGSSAAVIGVGAVGQFVVQGLRIAGASTIIAIDPSAPRRAQALELGATQAIAPDALPELLASMDEGPDYAFDAVGTAATATTAFRTVRNGGVGVLVGMGPPGQRLDVDPLEFVTQDKTLTGSVYGSGDPHAMTRQLLGYIADGRLMLAPMVGERFGLDSINDAVNLALRGDSGRALIVPVGSEV